MDVVAEIAVFEPDVVIWDLGWDWAGDQEIEAIADLEELETPIVALVSDLASAAEAWTAGARAILSRDASAEEMVAALQAVARGLVALDPVSAASILLSKDRAPGALVEALTPRELEVLQLVATRPSPTGWASAGPPAGHLRA